MKPCSSWHKPSAKEREGTKFKSCLHLTCGKKGAANDESMLFRPPTTMIMQLSPLSGVPSYTDEHANPLDGYHRSSEGEFMFLVHRGWHRFGLVQPQSAK